jgi:hypothetical protein
MAPAQPTLRRARIAGAAAAVLTSGVVAFAATSPARAAACVVTNTGCGPYSYAAIPMSNGYDTYVEAQRVGNNVGTVDTVTATNPGNWSVRANDVPYRYTGVQMFDNVQQLTNDWNGSGWGDSGSADTPMSALSSLAVNYTETSPSDANSSYEFAPDVWTSNYRSDVMFWADTSPVRCTDNGLNARNIVGQARLVGQPWTVYRYGGAGGEVIFVLDGTTSTDPVGTGTCARQASGSIDILAGFNWLAAKRIIPALGNMSQLNTGWEITSADRRTFTMSRYSITATVAGTPTPGPTPLPTLPPRTAIYGCVTGPNRVLEHVYTSALNFRRFLAAHRGTCPGGFPVANG